MLSATLVTAVCHVAGTAPFLRPDGDCTPGAHAKLTPAQVCVHKRRPSLRAAEKRSILASYDVPGFANDDGELDHRVPFFLGGTTDRRNIWPEAGARPNPKDDLEQYVRQRVCVDGTMRVRTARGIFRSDWVAAYRRYGIT
jgi:hypothetical protein